MKTSKRLKEARSKIEVGKLYPLEEAVQLVKDTSTVKFDASIEVHIDLGINAQKSDQLVRSTVALPHGTGKTLRVAAFVPEEQVAKAKEAGADFAGHKLLIEDIKNSGKCEFDVAVAHPIVMKDLGVIARTLGQKGLMPNPKTGTIGDDIVKMIGELKKGKVAYKNDSGGTVHVAVGKVSFDVNQLAENITTLLDSVRQTKPSGVKGTFIKSVHLASSMGPAVAVTI